MSDSNSFDSFNTNFSSTSGTRDELDLTGMDIPAAKEYVMAYLTTLKQTQKDMKVLSEEIALWQGRVTFAQERSREDLKAAAQAKVSELSGKYARLEAEEKELGGKVRTLLANLKKLQGSFTPTVNVDQLQAEFDMIVGEKDELAEKFKEEETLSELEKLKQKLKDEGSV